jgi:hypothetical protein
MAYEAPKDYIDVAARITEFRTKHPGGYLAPLNPAEPFRIVRIAQSRADDSPDRVFIVVVAGAYREPGDTSPGVGMAWEQFPGTTPYTRNSELMNAETSAWGRAIIAVGAADSKKGIASAEEVRNRQAEHEPDEPRGPGGPGDWRPPANPNTRKAQRHNGRNGPLPDDEWTGPPPEDETVAGGSGPDQWQLIAIKLTEKGITTREGKLAFCTQHANRPITSSKELSWVEAAEIIRKAEALPAAPGPLATKGTNQ